MELTKLINGWNRQIDAVIAGKPLSLSEMQTLIKDTYCTFTAYAKDSLVPKALCELTLTMEKFSEFSAMMEENEMGKDHYHWEAFENVIDSLCEGFFSNSYSEVYPKLAVADVFDHTFLWDVENDPIEGYIALVNQCRTEDCEES